MCQITIVTFLPRREKANPSVTLKPSGGYLQQFASVYLGAPEFEELQILTFPLQSMYSRRKQPLQSSKGPCMISHAVY
jgi:hypothetical protein